MSERQAIVFDLDDTLYPREWFLRSAFLEVSRRVEGEFGVPREAVMRTLLEARRAHAGREFQWLCRRLGLPETMIPDLVAAVRAHHPSIRLPDLSASLLRRLRPRWRIGVLTNGIPSVQRRKVEALGLTDLVDVVLYAEEHAPGGKPMPAAFHAVRDRLDVPAEETVFVGDDPVADISGASGVGFFTIHISTSIQRWPTELRQPDVRLSSIGAVPGAADRLLSGKERHRVA